MIRLLWGIGYAVAGYYFSAIAAEEIIEALGELFAERVISLDNGDEAHAA